MSIALECKKLKRTGALPAFFGGGIIASAIPVINMAARSELYLDMDLPPIRILLNANWQMMSMLNLLLIIAGTCLLYHIEFSDNAMQKMRALPLRESSMFFQKVILTIALCAVVLLLEAGAVTFCTAHWFQMEADFQAELFKNFAYEFCLLLPCIALSMLLASIFENMWISLGIGVICVFTATLLPTDHFLLSLFPFAAPFQLLPETDPAQTAQYVCAMLIELIAISLAELIFVRRRRDFQ